MNTRTTKGKYKKFQIVTILLLIAISGVHWNDALASQFREGLTMIGLSIGHEARTLDNDFRADLYYGTGFAYKYPDRSYSATISNILGLYLRSPDKISGVGLKDYKIYLWYSYGTNPGEIPSYGLLSIYDINPRGTVETGRQYSWEISYQISREASFGVQQIGASVGSSVGISWGVTEPGKFVIMMDTKGYQDAYTPSRIRSMTKCERSSCVVIGGDDGWKFRYLGEIDIKRYNDKLPHFLKLATIFETNNYNAFISDNKKHERVVIVAVVTAEYEGTVWRWLPLIGIFPEPRHAATSITYILGDNSQAEGNDGYLWFYRVEP